MTLSQQQQHFFPPQQLHSLQRSLLLTNRVLVGLGLLAGVTGEEVGDHQAYTGVSSEHELWIAVLLVMITTILLWEWRKRAAGGVKKAVKMKMFKVPPKTGLTKGEGKELLALLGIDERSVEQEARLTALIAK